MLKGKHPRGLLAKNWPLRDISPVMLLLLHTYPSKFDSGRNVMAQVKFINASFGSWAINVLIVIYLMNLTSQK